MSRWETVTLAEVCTNIQDGAHRSPQVFHQEPGSGRFLYITSKNIRNGYMKLDNVSYCEADFHEAIYRRCNAEYGDVLLTKDGASTGNVTLNTLREPISLLSSVCLLKTDPEKLVPAFLYYYIRSDHGFRQLTGKMTGAAIKRIILRTIKKSEISLPSVSEQKRIVSILDEAFSAIAQAKENAQKNLANARELFESYLNRVFTQQGPGWQEKTLRDVCDFENGDRGKNYPNKSEYVESGVPWINTGHINRDGSLSLRKMNYISREKFDSLRSGKIRSGDLVYCLRGATLGKTALVDPLDEGAVASSLVIVRPQAGLNSRYLYFFLTSKAGQSQIETYSNGAAQPNLGAKSVAQFKISICDSPRQDSVVNEVERIAVAAQRLETIYTQKLANLDELKQSLLQKAFTGQLTTELAAV